MNTRNWELTDWRTSPWWQIFNDFAYWGEDLSGKYQPDDEEKLEEGIDYLIPAPDLFLEWVKKGYVKQYRITPSSTYPNSVCDYCREQQGVRRLDSRSILPPFHPNCRCMMTLLWEGDADKYNGLKDLYNPYNGKILHELCTKEVILDMLSTALAEECKLEEKISWSDVVKIGFWKPGMNKPESISNFDPSKHVGWETTLCVNTCQNVDAGSQNNPENTLDYWFSEAKKDGEKLIRELEEKSSSLLYFLFDEPAFFVEFSKLVGEWCKYDLKNRIGDKFWGSPPRNNWAYVYKGTLLPYDAPGNILPGYLAYYARIDLFSMHAGGTVEAFLKSLGEFIFSAGGKPIKFGDDSRDAKFVERGFNYAKTGVWK